MNLQRIINSFFLHMTKIRNDCSDYAFKKGFIRCFQNGIKSLLYAPKSETLLSLQCTSARSMRQYSIFAFRSSRCTDPYPIELLLHLQDSDSYVTKDSFIKSP